MLTAIDLYDQALSFAHKIDDELSKRHLPSEPPAFQLPVPEPLPERLFGICLVRTKLARFRQHVGRYFCFQGDAPTLALPQGGRVRQRPAL
ncbi:MAG: hypothetical protein AAFV19_07600 [Pseudomonadota bacterium]